MNYSGAPKYSDSQRTANTRDAFCRRVLPHHLCTLSSRACRRRSSQFRVALFLWTDHAKCALHFLRRDDDNDDETRPLTRPSLSSVLRMLSPDTAIPPTNIRAAIRLGASEGGCIPYPTAEQSPQNGRRGEETAMLVDARGEAAKQNSPSCIRRRR